MDRRGPDWWSGHEQRQRHRRDQHQRHRDRTPEPAAVDGCPRNAANARERARMRVLSKAFGRLKTTLPWVPADTKLSKLDTLRLATTYIAHLSSLLAATEQADVVVPTDPTAVTSTHPPDSAATWPYSVYNSAKQCSSPEDHYQYDCYNALEQKSSYSGYDSYCTSSVN